MERRRTHLQLLLQHVVFDLDLNQSLPQLMGLGLGEPDTLNGKGKNVSLGSLLLLISSKVTKVSAHDETHRRSGSVIGLCSLGVACRMGVGNWVYTQILAMPVWWIHIVYGILSTTNVDF